MSTVLEPSRQGGSRLVRLRSARAREWNEKIRAAVRADSSGPLPFFCECGMSTCRSSVWLTLQEACDAIESGALLIDGHFFRQVEARLSRPA